MLDWAAWLAALAVVLLFAVAAWSVSVAKRDVSIVDGLWSLMFLLALLAYAGLIAEWGSRWLLVLATTVVWSLRLSVYITWRNWGEPEDARYQAIRRNNQPNFAFKSLYLVFALQAVLAWLIAAPLPAAFTGAAPLGPWDLAGVVVWLFGVTFQGVADWQLARFKSDPRNRGKVMDRGLWRYTRHPNYFGEACVWWGFYLIAVGAGGWWTLFSPLLITFLLLRVSGVTLLEKDIQQRRPGYREYRNRTNAFIPGPPRSPDIARSEAAQ